MRKLVKLNVHQKSLPAWMVGSVYQLETDVMTNFTAGTDQMKLSVFVVVHLTSSNVVTASSVYEVTIRAMGTVIVLMALMKLYSEFVNLMKMGAPANSSGALTEAHVSGPRIN